MIKKYSILVILFLLISCGKSKIDGSNQESFNQSVSEMADDLELLQKDKLKEAIDILWQYETNHTEDSIKWSQLRRLLNGKTSDEIFKMADEVAKERGIKWSSTSMSSLSKENNASDSLVLKNANNISLIVSEKDWNADGKADGLMIFPNILDKNNQSINFQQPIQGDVYIYSNGQVIQTMKVELLDNSMGNPSLNRGVKLPYGQISSEKIKDGKIDLEFRVFNNGEYLTAQKSNIDYTPKLSNESEAEKEIEDQVVKESLSNFYSFLNDGQIDKAYEMSKNPKWGNFDRFSSTTSGFGAIQNVEVYEIRLIERTPTTAKLYVFYSADDSKNGKGNYKQNIDMEKIDGRWQIINSKTLDYTKL